jgi:hypothetical protein
VKKRWVFLGLAVLLGLATAGAFVDRNRIVPGLLAGEPFHRWRPARYWREVLRADGTSGTVSQATVQQFRFPVDSSVAVLKVCIRDPDPNVRWPAAWLMGDSLYANNVVPALREATRDELPAVRVEAVVSLGGRGADARPAIPELVDRFHNDPDDLVRFFAERALWSVAPEVAHREGGWRVVTSESWGFTADFPAEPQQEDIVKDSPWGPAKSRSFNAPYGAMRCVVVVTDYPDEFVQATTVEQRLDAFSNTAANPFPGGQLTEKRDIELDGHKGREYLVEVENVGVLRHRVFLDGRRAYVIFVAYKPKYLIAPAAQHFLDSFKIKPSARP